MFQSTVEAARAVDAFRVAGFHAYSIEVGGRDAPGHGVFLGPYAELAPAERDLARARRIPGYDGARIVPIGPKELPAEPGDNALPSF
jgi:hypothetical protein